MSIFAERLKELRATESQASFAASIGVNRVQYAKYESGYNAPSVEILERICRVHACSADWLLGIERSGSVTAGAGAAVAIGKNARASSHIASVAPGDAPQCARCPYKKRLAKIEKAMKA